MDLEKEHKGTLGYLGMTTQLASENRLYFKAGIKRVTNCVRSNGITSNVRRKKRNRIKRREEYINDNLLKGRFDRKNKNEVWVTDTTEIKYGNSGHKARVHVVLDLYGRLKTSRTLIRWFTRTVEQHTVQWISIII